MSSVPETSFLKPKYMPPAPVAQNGVDAPGVGAMLVKCCRQYCTAAIQRVFRVEEKGVSMYHQKEVEAHMEVCRCTAIRVLAEVLHAENLITHLPPAKTSSQDDETWTKKCNAFEEEMQMALPDLGISDDVQGLYKCVDDYSNAYGHYLLFSEGMDRKQVDSGLIKTDITQAVRAASSSEMSFKEYLTTRASAFQTQIL